MWVGWYRFQGRLHVGHHPSCPPPGQGGLWALQGPGHLSGPFLRPRLPVGWPGWQPAGPAGQRSAASHAPGSSAVRGGLSPLGWGVAPLAYRPHLTHRAHCGLKVQEPPNYPGLASVMVDKRPQPSHHAAAKQARASNLFKHRFERPFF